jgi:hypothetical protein
MMSTQMFDTVTRRVAGLSRRRSLLSLGGAALAATVTSPRLSAAKKKNKKGADCKQKEKQRCSKDAAACKATITPLCSPDNPAACLAVQACCEECSANGLVTCFLATQEP